MFRFSFIFLFLSHFLFASDSLSVKVHFVYGSKPKHAFKKTELLYFVPKKEHLAYTNFGFKPVIADLLWLRGVSYFMYHLDYTNNITNLQVTNCHNMWNYVNTYFIMERVYVYFFVTLLVLIPIGTILVACKELWKSRKYHEF